MNSASSTLLGKVALVTGASRGIGAAIARRLAHEGASVAITYTSSPQKAEEVVTSIRAEGGKALATKADNADADAVRHAVTETIRAFGRLDILVNNAGILLQGTIDQFSLSDFDRIVAVNIRGVFIACQEAAKHLTAGGRIINIGSCVADRTGFPGASAYGMTKAAVASLTRGLARDLGPKGITVNNVQPGPTATDMNPADGDFASTLKGLIPLARYGESHEIASLVAYLANEDAAFINGASLTVDGGYNS